MMPKGKLDPDFKRWKELLDEATRTGLVSTQVSVAQIPSIENGHLAVVHATVRFADGREFQDVGDANPESCQAETAKALVRMASTRAKARCFRDALNVGEVADVELPNYGKERHYGPQEDRPRDPVPDVHRAMVCSNAGCGKPLTQGQYKVSLRAYGAAFCPACQKTKTRTA